MRIPVLSIIFLFVISILIDWYIFTDVRRIWKKKGCAWYCAASLICYAILIVAICLPRRDAASGISAVMWLLFTYLTIYTGKFAYLVVSAIGRGLSLLWRNNIINVGFRWIGLFFGVSLVAVMWCGAAYTRHHIRIEEETIYSSKLPSAFEGYKIVQISDLHVGTWGNDTSFIKKLVDTVNSLDPDLVLFTGDIVNRETSEITPFLKVLAELKARDGVFSVLGNHDYGDYVDWATPEQREENNRLLALHQKDMGWQLLNNESVYIKKGNDSILLIGVENWGEPPFPQYGSLNTAISEKPQDHPHQNDGTFKLLMSHNPEHWNREVSKHTNIDLTLSGHTHAMQTLLKIGNWKWSPAKYRYDQWGGLYERNNSNGEPTRLYVNTGAGAVGMPARLLSAYPEVTLITLKRER